MVRPRDIDEELFGDRVGDGLVIGEDGAVECRRRQAACEAESGQQADQAAESPDVYRGAHWIRSALVVHQQGFYHISSLEPSGLRKNSIATRCENAAGGLFPHPAMA